MSFKGILIYLVFIHNLLLFMKSEDISVDFRINVTTLVSVCMNFIVRTDV